MKITVENLTRGKRVLKTIKNVDVPIDGGEKRTFDAHPHLVRILQREAAKSEPAIAIFGDADELASVYLPGGNMTVQEQTNKLLAEKEAREKLNRLRVEAGLAPVEQDAPAAPAGEPQIFQEAANEPQPFQEEYVDQGAEDPAPEPEPEPAQRPNHRRRR